MVWPISITNQWMYHGVDVYRSGKSGTGTIRLGTHENTSREEATVRIYYTSQSMLGDQGDRSNIQLLTLLLQAECPVSTHHDIETVKQANRWQ